MQNELLDLAKQARERKLVYSDNTEKDSAVRCELEIMAIVAEKKAAKLAESADIGKLDSVDNKANWNGVLRRESDKSLGKLSEVLGNPALESIHGLEVALIEYAIKKLAAGSAETGGEKASDKKEKV